MRRALLALVLLLSAAVCTPVLARGPADDTAKAAVVKRCAEIYHSSGHPCACASDPMRNGGACGRRSAHDKAGGASPVCSIDEVTPELLASPAQIQERCHYHGT